MAKALAAAAYISLTLLWPALRSRRRTGSFGIARLDRQQALTALGLIVCAGGILIPTPWPAPSWVKAVGWTAIAAGTIVTCTAQAQMGRSWRF
ncbi:MAG TPA: hypothetical protein VKE70_25940, partial [Candidatus Solibacter sp.]|nr:hypothetical protein [Candidatus Solibacter sp.]